MAFLIWGAALAASLLILYLLACLFRWVADRVTVPFFILVARPFVKSELGLKEVGSYFYLAFEKSLQYPPHLMGDTWQGVYVIARFVLFLVCSIILTADVYNMLERLPLLFGGAGE